MRRLAFAALCLLSATLAGCLVSETPLLDARTAGAAPLAAGPYRACSAGEDAANEPCSALSVERLGAATIFVMQEDDGPDRTEALFRPLSGGGYLIQMKSEGDDGYLFFYGESSKGAFAFSLIDCQSIPVADKNRLVERGRLGVSGDGLTCTARARKGAERGARAFVAAGGHARRHTILTPVA